VARKNLLADLIVEHGPGVGQAATAGSTEFGAAGRAPGPPTLGNRGAVGAMSRSLEQISRERQEAKVLSEQLASGQSVLEIDAALIDDSIVPDRMLGQDSEHLRLVESIRTEGQIVPALLRPHPAAPGRFQIAYGHRRVRALRELARPVRAVVRELSDDELVIAQGKENGDRQDLTFIERARYAALLEERAFKRDTIMAALSVDKTELSRMISTARSIPANVAIAIGRAPKIGRRRWIEFTERIATDQANKALMTLVESDRFRRADSDTRFAMAFAALSNPGTQKPKPAVWSARDGRAIARVERTSDRFVLSVDERAAPAFGDFVLERLPDLYEAFLGSKEATT
jgi:ParB family transcriptional regulator, chromosome partitioning protein